MSFEAGKGLVIVQAILGFIPIVVGGVAIADSVYDFTKFPELTGVQLIDRPIQGVAGLCVLLAGAPYAWAAISKVNLPGVIDYLDRSK